MHDLVSLAAGDARADLAPTIGGSVVAFRWRDLDVLRPTPPATVAQGNVRHLASWPLVPFSNRIADARLRVDGNVHDLDRNWPEHPNAIHGVGFERPWTVAAAHAARATLVLDYDPSQDARHGWPFAFRARQGFALVEHAGAAALTMTLAIENADTRAFPFGLGWHPFFPCSPATLLGFRVDGMWETGPTLLPTRHVPVPPSLAFDTPRPIGTTTMDTVFTGFAGTVQLDPPERGLRVTVEGDSACPFLVVYIPPQATSCAIEPVTQMTDAFNRHADGESGTGTRILPPGASFSCTMRIVAHTLPAKLS